MHMYEYVAYALVNAIALSGSLRVHFRARDRVCSVLRVARRVLLLLLSC